MALEANIENVIDAFVAKHNTRATVQASVGSFWTLCGLGDGSFAAVSRTISCVPRSSAICRIARKYSLNIATQTVLQIDVPSPPTYADYSEENKEVRDFLEV